MCRVDLRAMPNSDSAPWKRLALRIYISQRYYSPSRPRLKSRKISDRPLIAAALVQSRACQMSSLTEEGSQYIAC
jgi:hypothetical protein